MTTAIAWYRRSFVFSLPLCVLLLQFFPSSIFCVVFVLLIAFFRCRCYCSFFILSPAALFTRIVRSNLPTLFTGCAGSFYQLCFHSFSVFVWSWNQNTHTHTLDVCTPIWWVSLAFNSYVEIDSWNSRCLPTTKLLDVCMNEWSERICVSIVLLLFSSLHFMLFVLFASMRIFVCLNEQRNWWQVEKRKEKRTGRRCTMNSFWCRCAWCLFFIDSLNVCNGEEFTEKNYLPWIWKVICNRNNAMQCYKLHFTFAHSFSWFICDIVDGRPFEPCILSPSTILLIIYFTFFQHWRTKWAPSINPRWNSYW